MDDILQDLIDSLQRAKDELQKPSIQQEIHELLRPEGKDVLPDHSISQKASQAIDLLHEIESILEPGHLVLADHFFGHVSTKCLVAAVELKVADILEQDGPTSTLDLAKACNAKPLQLHQTLRLLSGNGIFNYSPAQDQFSNNRTSRMLLDANWARHWVSLYGNQFYDIASGIPSSLRQDEPRCAAQVHHDTDEDIFTLFQRRGWVQQFHETLSAGARAQAAGVLADYPWHECAHDSILDIGGGAGAQLALLLRRFPHMRGSILDLPAVIEGAREAFHGDEAEYADIAERVPAEGLVGGSFLESVPRSKVYTMKWVLHNWSQEDAVTILRNVRSAIVEEPGARLVVLDSVLGYGRTDRLSRYADIIMMMSINALERTMAEWEFVAKEAGWRIDKVYPLRNAWACAIDMRPI